MEGNGGVQEVEGELNSACKVKQATYGQDAGRLHIIVWAIYGSRVGMEITKGTSILAGREHLSRRKHEKEPHIRVKGRRKQSGTARSAIDALWARRERRLNWTVPHSRFWPL